jgi:hypothetical protein
MGKENKIRQLLIAWYIAVFAAIALSAGCWQDHIDPPVVICKSAQEASEKSQILAVKLNGKYENGTPKGWYMVHGGDIIVVDKAILLSQSQLGHILTYFPDWKPIRENTCHRMVGWDSGGAIMEGDGERNTSENKNRVNKGNYDGEVVKIYRVQ